MSIESIAAIVAVIIPGAMEVLQGNVWLYGLYGGLAAGLMMVYNLIVSLIYANVETIPPEIAAAAETILATPPPF